MRNRALHNSLREFCLDAAGLLTADLREGAEIPFDLVDEGSSGLSLYHYRPRTRDFVETRWLRLRELPSFASATAALTDGAEAYLNVHALPGAGSDAVLEDILARIYDEATDFAFPERRFEEVAAELDDAAGGAQLPATVLVRLDGVDLTADLVEVEPGLSIVLADALPELPPALGRRRSNGVLCRIELSQTGAAELPIDEVVSLLRRLMTTLRLTGAAGARLAPIAWGRPGEGPWRPLPIDIGGRKRGEPVRIEPEDGIELHDLMQVLTRARYSSRVAWALNRYELGCARPLASEAMSDYLLALRALLAGSDRADLRIGERLAVLCADPDDRPPVALAVATAIEVERDAMAGEAGDIRGVVAEVEANLRALLRDLVCGYLDDDLVTVADDLLVAGDADLDVVARDTRASDAGEDEASRGVIEAETHEMVAVEATATPAPTPPISLEDPPPSDPSGKPDAPLSDDDWGFDDGDDADLYAGPV